MDIPSEITAWRLIYLVTAAQVNQLKKKVLKKSSLKIIIQIYVPFLPLEFEPYYKMDKDPVKEQAQNPTSMDKQGGIPATHYIAPLRPFWRPGTQLCEGGPQKTHFIALTIDPWIRDKSGGRDPSNPLYFPP